MFGSNALPQPQDCQQGQTLAGHCTRDSVTDLHPPTAATITFPRPCCSAQLRAGELELPKGPIPSVQSVSTGIKCLIQVSRQMFFFISCS